MKINHNFYLNLAFNIAENHLGKTKSNPSVGCIVVKNDTVISSGITSINGRPHAEYNALNKKINFGGSRMYVTLEPCSHYGKTPPCINIIKKKNIKNVYFNFNDPDKRSYKKAKNKLKLKNISLKQIKTDKNSFYKSYFLNKKNEIPLVDAKIALSKDNYTINKKSKWITNFRSRKVGHLLRSKYDSILSTSKSINKDNSMLNCRIEGLNNSKPDLIIIDRELKLKKNLSLIKFAKIRKTYILTTSKNKRKIFFFKKRNFKIINLKKLKERKDFINFFNKIFKLGVRRLLVESGLTFLNQLLKYKFINDLYVFQSNKKLNSNGHNKTNINFKIKKSYKMVKVNLNDEKLFKIKVN